MLRRRNKTSGHATVDPLASATFEELRVRSAVLAYVVGEGHEDETIFELARKFSPDPGSIAVESSVRDLVGEGLLTMDSGKVVAGSSWISDPVNP